MESVDLVFLVWKQIINNTNSELTVKLIAEAPYLANQVAGLLAKCCAKHLIHFLRNFYPLLSNFLDYIFYSIFSCAVNFGLKAYLPFSYQISCSRLCSQWKLFSSFFVRTISLQ